MAPKNKKKGGKKPSDVRSPRALSPAGTRVSASDGAKIKRTSRRRVRPRSRLFVARRGASPAERLSGIPKSATLY